MAFESVRPYLQLASGLGEMTKAKAMEAAQGLLTLPTAEEVGRRAAQATALADQLLEAAKANRNSLVTLVRSEVESALTRSEVARSADLEAARRAITALARDVDDLRAAVLSGALRRGGGAAPGTAGAVTTAPSRTAAAEESRDVAPPAPRPRPRKAAGAKRAAARTTAVKAAASTPPRGSATTGTGTTGTGTTGTGTTGTGTTGAAAARKVAGRDGAARKTGTTKSGTTKTGTTKTAAKKTATRKRAVKKATE